jgi:hypothetical protein
MLVSKMAIAHGASKPSVTTEASPEFDDIGTSIDALDLGGTVSPSMACDAHDDRVTAMTDAAAQRATGCVVLIGCPFLQRWRAS